MKLLILGAGASWGSSHIGERPKLTNDLLPILRANFPKSWGRISDQFAEAHDKNFERIMDAVLGRDAGNARFMNQDLGSYFAQFEPDDESLYVRLMREVDLSNVIICTLNYDLLLQRAAAHCGKGFYLTGFQYDHWGNPVPKNGDSSLIELLLPHGSAGLVDTGFGWQNNMMVGGAKLADTRPEARLPRLCLNQNELAKFYRQAEMNPIMSFIRRDKDTLIGRKNLEVARERFAEVCNKCDGIAVVGMQLNIRDKHILRPLIYSRAPVVVAVGDGGASYKCMGSRVTETGQKWLEAFDSIEGFLRQR